MSEDDEPAETEQHVREPPCLWEGVDAGTEQAQIWLLAINLHNLIRSSKCQAKTLQPGDPHIDCCPQTLIAVFSSLQWPCPHLKPNLSYVIERFISQGLGYCLTHPHAHTHSWAGQTVCFRMETHIVIRNKIKGFWSWVRDKKSDYVNKIREQSLLLETNVVLKYDLCINHRQNNSFFTIILFVVFHIAEFVLILLASH